MTFAATIDHIPSTFYILLGSYPESAKETAIPGTRIGMRYVDLYAGCPKALYHEQVK